MLLRNDLISKLNNNEQIIFVKYGDGGLYYDGKNYSNNRKSKHITKLSFNRV